MNIENSVVGMTLIRLLYTQRLHSSKLWQKQILGYPVPRSLIDIFRWKHKDWYVFLLNEGGGKCIFKKECLMRLILIEIINKNGGSFRGTIQVKSSIGHYQMIFEYRNV